MYSAELSALVHSADWTVENAKAQMRAMARKNFMVIKGLKQKVVLCAIFWCAICKLVKIVGWIVMFVS